MDDSFEEQAQRSVDLLGLKMFFYTCAAFGAAIPDDAQDFFVELVRNGCPLEAITKAIRNNLDKKKEGGG